MNIALTTFNMATFNPSLTTVYGFKFGSVGELISILVTPALTLISLALLFYFIWAAYKYLTAGDSKEQVASAKDMITHAIIGIVLFLVLFLVVEFITNVFKLGAIVK